MMILINYLKRVKAALAWRFSATGLRFAGSNPIVWPKIEEEIGDWRQYLSGKCLNAGAGARDISKLVDGEVINQDIESGLHNENIHIYSPLHQIPIPDGLFDSIMCNAVLEHVVNPDEVMAEFYRVLKAGGHLYLCVPFLQPYHPDPTDYQRYTRDGLCTLVEKHGFTVLRTEPVHSVYHTLAWIVARWLTSDNNFSYTILRCLIFPILRNRCKYSRKSVDSIASAFRLIATKNENVKIKPNESLEIQSG
jgi:SAM-dependent methyltransferase